ncbi:MAG TPA: hypothetical protein DDW50_15995 [Firmicutes bacterium]|jgi:spore germination protein|nr:hypothetical protein [Bacillota bacterium]
MANERMNNGEIRVKLSPSMGFILLFVTGMGLAYLIPYYDAAQICGPSGYWAVLSACILMIPFIFLISELQHRFPQKNIFGAAIEIYGGIGGPFLNFIYLGALIFQIIFVVHNTAELIVTYSLNRTPLWAIIILIMLTSVFFVKDGLIGVSRLAGFVFIPVLLFRILILILASHGMRLVQLLPIFSAGPIEYFKGGLSLAMLFFPIGIGLSFIYPLLSKPGKLKLVSGSLLGIQTLLTFFSVAIVIGVFGDIGLQSFVWPVFEAIRRIDVSFLALDQVGIIFLIVWFTVFLTGLSLMLYISGSEINQQFKKLDYRWCLWGSTLIIGAGAISIPSLFYDVYVFTLMSRYSIALIYVHPLLVYLGALIRRRGVKTV